MPGSANLDVMASQPKAARGVGILIVEDDRVTREGICERVMEDARFEVRGAVGSLAGARDALSSTAVDVVLVDLELEDGHGIELIRELARVDAAPLCMVISVFGDEHSVIEAIEAGARGYLLNDDDAPAVGEALEQLLAGGSPISPPIARHLIARFQARSGPVEENVRLSERELEVLELAARGYTYHETASLLGVSLNTVSSYTRRVYGKLAVNSRSEAVFEAQRLGLMRRPRDGG